MKIIILILQWKGYRVFLEGEKASTKMPKWVLFSFAKNKKKKKDKKEKSKK